MATLTDITGTQYGEFYLHLNSQKSCLNSMNKCNNFSTSFPTEYKTLGYFEVGLQQISIPLTWYTFPHAADTWMEYRYVDTHYRLNKELALVLKAKQPVLNEPDSDDDRDVISPDYEDAKSSPSDDEDPDVSLDGEGDGEGDGDDDDDDNGDGNDAEKVENVENKEEGEEVQPAPIQPIITHDTAEVKPVEKPNAPCEDDDDNNDSDDAEEDDEETGVGMRITENMSPWHRVYFPLGCFLTAQEFCSTLSLHCGAGRVGRKQVTFSNAFQISYNSSTDKIYFKYKSGGAAKIRFSKKASTILGFRSGARRKTGEGMRNIGQLFSGDNKGSQMPPTVNSYILDKIFVFLDIIKPDFCIDEFKQLLHIVELKRMPGEEDKRHITVIPNRKTFKRLLVKRFQSITVKLEDASGRAIPFRGANGREGTDKTDCVHITLHFRPITFQDEG